MSHVSVSVSVFLFVLLLWGPRYTVFQTSRLSLTGFDESSKVLFTVLVTLILVTEK